MAHFEETRAQGNAGTDRPGEISRPGRSDVHRGSGEPGTIVGASWIWIIAGTLNIIAGVFSLPDFLSLAISLALGMVLITQGRRLRHAEPSARTALTVLACIFTAGKLWAAAVIGFGALDFVSFTVVVAATILMWVPRSQKWFAGKAKAGRSL